MGISLASIYMKDAPEFNLSALGESDKDWVFGVGEVPEAYYTKVECDINRNRPQDDNYWEAYPQIRTNCDLSKQLDIYWSATAIQPSGKGYEMVVNIPSGEEIFRFYQSWMISKDTYYPYPSSRDISVSLNTVELSIVFIVICGFTILIVSLGMLHCFSFRLRHRGIVVGIPETKVDWLLQSVQEAQISASSQLDSVDLENATSHGNGPTKKSRSHNEAWKKAIFTRQKDRVMNHKGLGKVQVDSRSLAPASSSSPIPKLSPGYRSLDHDSSTRPAPAAISSSKSMPIIRHAIPKSSLSPRLRKSVKGEKNVRKQMVIYRGRYASYKFGC